MVPHDAAALHILGSVLFRTEQYSQAEVWLQKARSIDQDSWSIAQALALTKCALGDLAASMEAFSEAIARAPDESTRTVLRTQMAHPVLASGDYKRGLPLLEGHQLPATQELGAAPAVALPTQRLGKKTELEGRLVSPMPGDTDQPLPRPRIVLAPPAPRDRKAELNDELDRLARGLGGYSDREIIAVAHEREKRRRLHRHLIEIAKLLVPSGRSPTKRFVEDQAAMPSSRKTPCMAV